MIARGSGDEFEPATRVLSVLPEWWPATAGIAAVGLAMVSLPGTNSAGVAATVTELHAGLGGVSGHALAVQPALLAALALIAAVLAAGALRSRVDGPR